MKYHLDVTWRAIPDPTYCGRCQTWVHLVDRREDRRAEHCPQCGRVPTLIEIGAVQGREDRIEQLLAMYDYRTPEE